MLALQHFFASVFAKSPSNCVEGVYHGNHSEWKEQNERNHVERPHGKILGRWIRFKILQIEPLVVTRSQAIGSTRRGAAMTQFTLCVFFDVARIRGLSAAAVFFFFCDLAAACYIVVRQYYQPTKCFYCY